MKKKLISLLCAVSMLMALPTLAFAAQFDSPSGTCATSNGVTLCVKGDVVSNGGYIVVEGTGDHADNAKIEGDDLAASFLVYKVGDIEFTALDMTFKVPAEYAGTDAVVYIQHEDGEMEAINVTVSADCIVSIQVTKLSTFTLVLDAEGAGEVTPPTEDTGDVSPQTGVSLNGVAFAGAAMLIAAGGVALAIRKKSAE